MQKILIIRFSSIGDIVLTSPVIRCIRQKYPDAGIHYLTKEKFYPVIKANPHITRIHTFNDDLKSVIKELQRINFDFIVDLHKNLRSSRVKLALRKPTGTFNKLNHKKWLLTNMKINTLPDVHIVDRYFKAVEELGVVNDKHGLEYYIPEEDMLGLTDLPDKCQEDYVALVIGGMHYTKMLPLEKLIELCGLIDKPILLLGGPKDEERGDHITEAFPDRVFNTCGLYNINQSASILSMASKVITHDTGLMHIAAAFKKDIYSVWGNTIPQFGMYPYLPAGEGRSEIFEVRGLKCRPCSKIGFSQCPKKHFRCMMDINLEKLADLVNE